MKITFLPERSGIVLPVNLRHGSEFHTLCRELTKAAGGCTLGAREVGHWNTGAGLMTEWVQELYVYHTAESAHHIQQLMQDYALYMLEQGEQAVLITVTDSGGRSSAGLVTRA